MKKFRIIKKQTVNGNGDVDTKYIIQKKVMFWYFDYRIETYYDAPICGLTSQGKIVAFKTKARVVIFSNLKQAKEALQKITNPFKLNYKGNKIIRVFSNRHLEDMYINLSQVYEGRVKYGHEYDYDLIKLKEKIDKREKKVVVSVVQVAMVKKWQ